MSGRLDVDRLDAGAVVEVLRVDEMRVGEGPLRWHHHLGFNTWQGQGAPPPPEGVVGLRHWTVELDDAEQVAAVRSRLEAAGAPVRDADGGLATRDPWGIELRVVRA